MIDTNSIAVAVGKLLPVINKTGNAGRAVRRAIEERFCTYVDGNAVGHVTVRSDLGGLPFAFLAMEVRREARLATEHAAEMGQTGLKFAVAEVDAAELRVVVEITVEVMPESMAARQAFLAVVVDELETMARNLEQLPQAVDKVLFHLFSDGNALAAVRSQRYLEQFESLVAGKFADIGNVPCVLLDMAKDLNPAVPIAEAKLDASFAVEDAQRDGLS